jgi:photosystem II stability/assembly factor-like uncharacterized protein
MKSRLLLPILFTAALILACGLGTVTSTDLPSAATATASPTPEPPPGPTDTPLPTPALPVAASPALLRIDFQGPANGWAIADGAVVRTVDGGGTWYNATPPGLSGIGYSTGLFVLDEVHAWVQAPGADFYTGTLCRTADGGLTWASFSVPFGSADLQFLDVSTGKVMADRGAGAGSQAVEILGSSDGGETWTSLFHNDPSVPGSSDTLPLGGIKNGMAFQSPSRGWVTGSRPVDGEVYLFVTNDGGASWAQQAVPLPAGYESYQYLPQPPLFFGGQGLLPLNILMPAGGLNQTFYSSSDGGTTWSGDPTDANRVITSFGRYAFAGPVDGMSWDGGGVTYLAYALAPGVPGWGGMAASLDLTDRLSQLEYAAGPDGGFTAWALTSPDASGAAQLYRSLDNGATWTPLLP